MPVYWVFSALTGVLLLQWKNYKTVVIHNVHNPCGKTKVIHSYPQSSTQCSSLGVSQTATWDNTRATKSRPGAPTEAA